MTVLIERLNTDTYDLEPIARVDNGTITDGADAVDDLLAGDDVPTEADLLTRFRGPIIFARQVDDDSPRRQDGSDPFDGGDTGR